MLMEKQILQYCKKFIEEKGVILSKEIIENENEVRYNVLYAPFQKPTMVTVKINQNKDTNKHEEQNNIR